jgi:aspartyl-tRNA(Asn)/glutamyl-tRNA(Gln) amidotransferase subunit A
VQEFAYLTAVELLGLFTAGEASPTEVVEASIRRIEALDPSLGAVVTPAFETAVDEARAAESRHASRDARLLEGVPVVVKDMIDVAGVRTAYGSSIFRDNVPTADAALVARLREAGAVILGKTNTHEFAWGITTENPHWGDTRNPWDRDRVAGGSSGGSAVALAAGFAPLAVGTDTAGSIRIPSAFCGTCGLRPTFGSVDAKGVFPLAPSMDVPGPMARTPGDVRLLWEALGGTGREPEGRPAVALVSAATGGARPEPAVSGALAAAAAGLEAAGAEVHAEPLPEVRDAYDVLSPIQLAEAGQVHRHAGLWPLRAGDYGRDVRQRLERSAGVGLDDLLAASRARAAIRGAMMRATQGGVLLLSPVSAVPPTRLGEEGDFRGHVLPYTSPAALAGLPALALHAGFDDLGIPVGVQLTGPPGSEHALLSLGAAYHAATPDLNAKRPALPE